MATTAATQTGTGRGRKRAVRVTAVPMGIVAGVLAVAAGAFFGVRPPEAYGVCMACHGRDLVNWTINLLAHTHLEVAQASLVYPVLTTIGVLLGAVLGARISGEFRWQNPESPLKTFTYGGLVMNCALPRWRLFDQAAAAGFGGRGAGRDWILRDGGRRHSGDVLATLEGDAVTAAIATLVIGVVLGYLGQRSRMCFVGGIRDFILVRDAYLLKGLIAFGLTAWLAFPLAGLIGGARHGPFGSSDALTVTLTIMGGAGVGFFSTLANGCPLRQHVLAAQGVKSSIAYLAGFFAGAVIFHAWVAPLFYRLLP